MQRRTTGIDIGLLGNVPSWASLYGLKTFNRDEIARLLDLSTRKIATRDHVDLMTNFDCNRVSQPGRDRSTGDYKAAAGLSSVAVGDAVATG